MMVLVLVRVEVMVVMVIMAVTVAVRVVLMVGVMCINNLEHMLPLGLMLAGVRPHACRQHGRQARRGPTPPRAERKDGGQAARVPSRRAGAHHPPFRSEGWAGARSAVKHTSVT